MQNETIILIESEVHLPTFFRWLLNLSEIILPQSLRKSHRHVLLVWLTLLILACAILLFLIYFLYYRHERTSYSLLQSSQQLNFPQPVSPAHFSTSLHFEHPVQPIFIEPRPYRYARIKRLSSPKTFDTDFLTGQFRTIIQFQSLPD